MGIIVSILTNTAITTVLIGILVFLFRSWIYEKIVQSIKHKYDLDLEKYKSDLALSNTCEIEKFKAIVNSEYELIRRRLLRYSENQFVIYNEMWSSLCDLEVCVNDLWRKATLANLTNFANQLYDTRLKIKKGALLIEDIHYKQLIHILNEFEGFSFGKKSLIEMRGIQRNGNVDVSDIENTILNNAEIKNGLVQLLTGLMACLKRQIIGEPTPKYQ